MERQSSSQVMALPVHKSILAVDIEDSTRRTNRIKGELRELVYRFVREALSEAGVEEKDCDPYADRGDGLLVLIRAEVSKPLLIGDVIPALENLLRVHNTSILPTEQSRLLRLRVVIHAGEILYDGKGYFGEDLDVAFRLLDARGFKAHLRDTTAPLALVTSDEIYRSVIRQDYEGINGEDFSPLVTVTVGGRRRKGWVFLPSAGKLHAG
jgi:class 3 adenylate cyclase